MSVRMGIAVKEVEMQRAWKTAPANCAGFHRILMSYRVQQKVLVNDARVNRKTAHLGERRDARPHD